VIVLSSRSEGAKPWERWIAIEALWDGPLSIQPHGLTPEQFEAARDKGGLVTMALADGVMPLLPP
jgi:hypothetical protein